MEITYLKFLGEKLVAVIFDVKSGCFIFRCEYSSNLETQDQGIVCMKLDVISVEEFKIEKNDKNF